MKPKRKLKKLVMPLTYVFSLAILVVSGLLVSNFIGKTNNDDFSYNYVTGAMTDDKDSKVVNEIVNDEIIKPFTVESVQIAKNFYDKDSDESSQQNSIIYYEKTYMQNTGILYKNDDTFDVVSTLDGTVTSVKTDEILGNVVEIKHNSNLITIYQSLGEVSVKEGDKVLQGDKIGTSGENKLDSENKNELLFEVYYKGIIMNPEKFYEMKIEDLSDETE